MAGKHINFRWAEATPQHIIKKEVVEYIWPDEVFCLLCYVALFISGYEFGGNGSINNVSECGTGVCIYSTLCHVLHEIAYKGLRDRNINSIHGHVVSIVCSPAKGKLG